ncbi:eCIS core domain-containing protein [Arthrobacter dokdonensis]|uniref:eCIS core domain-containing protein n=1 Tax=Arthrobacter dokdonellae TaxID=2211210 RepID=UPI000DE59526|nr:DUF4157 domain-containing protein [Arthrobacter dokdonellae]
MADEFDGARAEAAKAAAMSVARPARATGEAARSGGAPLADGVRRGFEARFGRDFTRVRVHADSGAAALAQSMNAAALTVGSDIFFGGGRFQPGTMEGRMLLAHELTHTLQPAGQGVSTPGDASERAADRNAAAYPGSGMLRIPPGGRHLPGAVRRQPLAGAGNSVQGDPATALIEDASPFLASAIGSQTLDNFPTGQAEPTPDQLGQLKVLAATITVLLQRYTLSIVTITGHADTVGTEASNARLGQDRADAVAGALSGMGVPAAIMATDSQGEGPAQAVATKDNVPNARNRRVEIRFHPRKSPLGRMVPELVPPPGPGGAGLGPPAPKPIDLTYHPQPVPDNGVNLPPDFYKPLPPPVKGSGPTSIVDTVAEKLIDPVIDAVAGGLSKDKRDWLKEKARDAVIKGSSAAARAAAESLGLHDADGLKAVEKAVEAAIQEKGRGTP